MDLDGAGTTRMKTMVVRKMMISFFLTKKW